MAPVGAAAAATTVAAAATAPYAPTLTANDAAAYGRLFQTLPAARPGLVSSTSVASSASGVTHDRWAANFRAKPLADALGSYSGARLAHLGAVAAATRLVAQNHVRCTRRRAGRRGEARVLI